MSNFQEFNVVRQASGTSTGGQFANKDHPANDEVGLTSAPSPLETYRQDLHSHLQGAVLDLPEYPRAGGNLRRLRDEDQERLTREFDKFLDDNRPALEELWKGGEKAGLEHMDYHVAENYMQARLGSNRAFTELAALDPESDSPVIADIFTAAPLRASAQQDPAFVVASHGGRGAKLVELSGEKSQEVREAHQEVHGALAAISEDDPKRDHVLHDIDDLRFLDRQELANRFWKAEESFHSWDQPDFPEPTAYARAAATLEGWGSGSEMSGRIAKASSTSDPKVLNQIAQQDLEDPVLLAVLGNPSTSQKAVDHLSSSPRTKVAGLACADPRLSSERYETLLANPTNDYETTLGLHANPHLGADRIRMAASASDSYPAVRAGIASNPATPVSTLEELTMVESSASQGHLEAARLAGINLRSRR